MFKHIILSLVLFIGLSFSYEISFAEITETVIVTNCDGTRVSRTEAGILIVTHGETSIPGCVGGSKLASPSIDTQTNIEQTTTVTNCSGMRVTRTGAKIVITRVARNLENCIMTNTDESDRTNLDKYNSERGPALDIRSTDIVQYRTLQMKNK